MVFVHFGFLHLGRQIAAEVNFVVARTYAVSAGLRLSLPAGGGHLDFISEKGQFFGRDAQGGFQPEGDGEPALPVCAGFAICNLLVLNHRIVPPPASPRESGFADHTVAVRHTVQTEPGVGLHITVYGYIVVKFILFFRLFKIHLKGGTLVFLHAKNVVPPPFLQTEKTVFPVGGNDKGAAETAVFIGCDFGGSYFLVVSVIKKDLRTAVGRQ